MALIFPLNPSDGDLYPDPAVPGVRQYVYVAATNVWNILPATITNLYVPGTLTVAGTSALLSEATTPTPPLPQDDTVIPTTEWVNLKIAEAIAALPPPVDPVDPLDPLAPTTYIVPIIDSSGSMGAITADISAAMTQLRAVAKTQLYNDNEVDTAKYFKDVTLWSSERYLDIVKQDYRATATEPKKYVFLIFQNEAQPSYHGNSLDSSGVTGPTSLYTTDLNALVSVFNTYSSVAFIFFPVSGTYGSIFQTHLINAIDGGGGTTYTNNLSQINFYYHLGWTNSMTGQNYMDIINASINSGYVVPISFTGFV